MKKIFIVLLTILCLSSCEELGGNTNQIVGKWQLVQIEQEQVYLDGTKQSKTNAYDGKTIWDFKNDGTMKRTFEGKIEEFTYSFDEDRMKLFVGNDVFPVKEITNSTLIIRFDVGSFVSDKGGGGGKIYSYSQWKKI